MTGPRGLLLDFDETLWITAELFVMVTVPFVMSWVPVVIHSWVELFASGWGAMRHLPLSMCAPGFEVSVMDSPGVIQVLLVGACSRIRLCTILVSEVVIALALGGAMASVTALV